MTSPAKLEKKIEEIFEENWLDCRMDDHFRWDVARDQLLSLFNSELVKIVSQIEGMKIVLPDPWDSTYPEIEMHNKALDDVIKLLT